jgi:hypothetical protein
VRLPSRAERQRHRDFWIPHPQQELAGYVRHFEAMGRRPGVQLTRVGSVRGTPYFKLHIPATQPGALKVLITAGNHGLERASPAAALGLMDWLLAHPELRDRIDLTVVPMLNGTGFEKALRTNDQGQNLNRAFVPGCTLDEVTLFKRAVGNTHFDLAVDLHSARSALQGFFIIGEQGVGSRLLPGANEVAQKAAKAAARSRIPLENLGHDPYSRVSRGVYFSSNLGTMKSFLAARGTAASFTLEAPDFLGYADRVKGLTEIVRDLIFASLSKSA